MSIEFRLVCYATLDKFIRGGFAQPGDTDGQTKVRTRSQRTITHQRLPREADSLEYMEYFSESETHRIPRRIVPSLSNITS